MAGDGQRGFGNLDVRRTRKFSRSLPVTHYALIRMGWDTEKTKASPLFAKYGPRAEAESAREKLAARMEAQDEPGPEPVGTARKAPRRRRREPGAATARTGGADAPPVSWTDGRLATREHLRGPPAPLPHAGPSAPRWRAPPRGF